MARLVDQAGVTLIDLTEVERRETQDGRMTLNPIWDTHLNRRGALVVADRLRQALAHAEGWMLAFPRRSHLAGVTAGSALVKT